MQEGTTELLCSRAKQMGYTHGKEEIDGKERTVWTSKDKKTK